MNYRHIYHAGNFADVYKHLVLSLVLDHLRSKEGPFSVLDTHAGIGVYDIESLQAQKTQEAAQGILKFAAGKDLSPLVEPYLKAVYSLNGGPGNRIRLYPGSPAIAQYFLRDQDRLVLAELHPDDARTLKKTFAQDQRVSVHHRDGYEALKAFLPPPERRGLVLIDPPFEVPDEFAAMITGLITGYKRWPTGIYILWYPIKERAPLWKCEEMLIASGIRRILKTEFLIHPEDTYLRLNGCGMWIINPPWQLDKALMEVLPSALKTMGQDGPKGAVTWLVPE